VNGKPVKKHFLQNNDVIEIGKHKLKYFNDTPAQASAQDFERTMIIRKPVPTTAEVAKPLPDTQTNLRPIAPPAAPAAPAPMAAAMPPAPLPASSPSQPPPVPAVPAASAVRDAAIQVLSGAAAGRTLDLIKNLTTVGKPGVQVAVITRRPNGFFITHVEGANFPSVNGTPMGGQALQLSDHDLIEIAGVKMEFFFKP
jgi:hypothetical protein